jgi:tagatose 1,6-diphosphate aldolase
MSVLEQHRYRFVDPGVLADGDLELVAPGERWVDALLRTLHDPRTRAVCPKDAALTREQVVGFVREFPLGRQPANPERGTVPAYHFWMRVPARDGDGDGDRDGDGGARWTIAGGLNLRVGHTTNLEQHLGHIGYTVYPPARGHRYAARAVRLLLPLARREGINPLWITCNPDNVASRRTCELAGGRFVEIVRLPGDHPLYERGEREKCRYRFDL